MKSKLEPINQVGKEALEKIIGCEVCPLTVEKIRSARHVELLGMYQHKGPVYVYKCATDGGLARGGQLSTMHILIPLTAITPCSEEYAKTCPLFEKYQKVSSPFEDEGMGIGNQDDKYQKVSSPFEDEGMGIGNQDDRR